MCRTPHSEAAVMPTANGTSDGRSTAPIHVVIAGGGPAGQLTAINLLGRNDASSDDTSSGDGGGRGTPKYRVTLVDINEDYGSLTPEELKFHRSWMIGLSAHGLSALQQVPDLYNDYVSKVGVNLKSFSIHLGQRELKHGRSYGDAYIVDRNYVVAEMARYLNEKYMHTKILTTMYKSKVIFVDGEKRRILVRSIAEDRQKQQPSDQDQYLDYDVLIGCDGIRSHVRDSLVHAHRDFTCSIDDTFGKFKAVHIDCPSEIPPESLHMLPFCLPNTGGIMLPETGRKMNLALGHRTDHPPPEALSSLDPKVVSLYMKDNFKVFALDDYDDFARQWVNQGWSTTGQVHCNMYHSNKLNVLLLGDAAHATSPNIGQGMNTALADAAVLNRLLDEHGDDWSVVLPAFSEERVKEGNALTYMSYYSSSWNVRQETWLQLCKATRSALHRLFPRLIMEHPGQALGKGEKLSVTYDRLVRLGYLPSIQQTNDRIRREREEESMGLVTNPRRKGAWSLTKLSVVGAFVSLGALAVARRSR